MSAVRLKVLEWTPEYSVHVEEIDREHQTWFGAVNRLHEAMLAGKGKDTLGTLLAEMTQYTFDHFVHEEKLMAAIHYPDQWAHVQQHVELRCKAGAFKERFERGEATMTIELTLFLSDWIKQHTMTTDRRLGEFLVANRSSPGR